MDLTSPSKQNIQLFPLPTFTKKVVAYAFSFLLVFFVSFFLLHLITPFTVSHIGFLSARLPNSSKESTCDYSYGKWVRDESYLVSLYNQDCPFLDPGFRCHRNGRKDYDYLKWRWQPHGCDLPRFNASDFLERSRNGHIVFAGDSIGRNQWESLLCMLAQAVSNHSTIYEVNGNPITKHKGFLSMRFNGYNLTVEYYRVPFLVTVGHPPLNSSSQIQRAIRIDRLHWYSKLWTSADVLVFNAGHWWNKDKTEKMGNYFQEGAFINETMTVMEAFQKSLQTWKSWVVQNFDPGKSYIFFRNYAPVHYRNGTWDRGGSCNNNTEPETNHTKLQAEPMNNLFIHETIEQMKDVYSNAQVLNITYLTEFRTDGHPSEHHEQGSPVLAPQDCSHWCLPGVPDTWNKLLYAHLLSKDYRIRSTTELRK